MGNFTHAGKVPSWEG